MKLKIFIQVIVLIIVSSVSLSAQIKRIVNVTNSKEFVNALQDLKEWDRINVLPGEYDFQKRMTVSVAATERLPITISAKEPGKTIIKNQSWLIFKNSSYITIEGFDFQSTDGPVIELLGCNNIRITNNTFHLKETVPSIWVMIKGDSDLKKNTSHHNRVDHNLFENKKLLGNFVTIEGVQSPEFQVSQHDRIDNNYFRNIGPRVENVLEAIRVGWADISMSSGFTVIEKNLFEKCDGDPEVVSVKSSDDTIRYNTFRECLGVLSLRHGNRSYVDGNFFLGNGRTGTFLDSTGKTWTLGTGGIRFYGDNMKILNNYFEGLTGQKWDASLALTSGNTDYGMGMPLTKHYRARYTVVAFNTFVNNVSNIEVGYDGDGFQGNWWRLPPVEITVANNIVVGSNGDLVKVFQEPINSTWIGNVVSPKDNKAFNRQFNENEVAVADPQLTLIDGIWRLTKVSPARGRALGNFPYVSNDVDGQARTNPKDLGCDQVSDSPSVNKPLTKNDVGPDWINFK